MQEDAHRQFPGGNAGNVSFPAGKGLPLKASAKKKRKKEQTMAQTDWLMEIRVKCGEAISVRGMEQGWMSRVFQWRSGWDLNPQSSGRQPEALPLRYRTRCFPGMTAPGKTDY